MERLDPILFGAQCFSLFFSNQPTIRNSGPDPAFSVFCSLQLTLCFRKCNCIFLDKYTNSVYYYRVITIAETESFLKKASKLLSIEDKGNLISYLSEHPSAGDVIQGTGGIRKLRWAKGNKGKSGGFESFIIFIIKIYHFIC